MRIGSARMSRTRMRGLRLENGSWNTTCMRRRSGRRVAGREVVDAAAVEHDLSGGDVEQPQHGAADRGLAAAGLADQRQRLAALDVERDAVDGMDDAAACAHKPPPQRKVLLEVVDLEQSALMPPPPPSRRSGRPTRWPGAFQLERRRDLPAQLGRPRRSGRRTRSRRCAA